jgi:hypothetical protein
MVLSGRFNIEQVDDLANEIGKTIKAWLKNNGLE